MPPHARRIACLRIPDFPVAAHLRAGQADPAHPIGPAIVTRGDGMRAEVAAASEAARRAGIAEGMRVADACGLCPALREWSWLPALYDEAQTELVAALLAASPRVSRAGLGVFWLDAGGWDWRGGEAAFVEAARSAALAAGYPEARLGVADTAVAARAATWLQGYAVVQVSPGGDARFLAPLPLAVLPLPAEMLDLLGALGLESVGALAELAAGEVEARLGAEGVRAHRWARGLDDAREGPFAGRPPAEWSVEVEFPGPLERLEPLLFLLKSCLDGLADALAAEGLCARGLQLAIETEEGPVQHAVRPARPTRQAHLLLSICRSALEELRLPGRAVALRVEVEGVAPQVAEQADLFEAAQPDPAALTLVLTRLRGRWGRESVVRPAAADSHRPERRGRWEPVELAPERERGQGRERERGRGRGRGRGEATSAAPSDVSCGAGGTAGSHEPLIGGAAFHDGDGLRLVLRLWPEPRPLEVRIEDGGPGAVLLDGEWQAVRSVEGPERLSGDWWEDEYRREYYRVTTAAGVRLWVFYDPRRRGWFWHGWWD
jgi:protein ImuB